MEVCFARRFGKGSPYMNDPERVREALLWLRCASEDLDVAKESIAGFMAGSARPSRSLRTDCMGS